MTIIRAAYTGGLALLCLGCNKELKKSYPSPTHEGKNLLAFRLDGVDYVARGEKSKSFGFSLQTEFATGEIVDDSTSGRLFAIGIVGRNSFDIRIYFQNGRAGAGIRLDSLTGQTSSFDISSVDSRAVLYGSASIASGTLDIQHVNDSVFAGTFDVVWNSFDGHQFHLTDGLFDIRRQ